MTPTLRQTSDVQIRPLQYRDLEAVEKLLETCGATDPSASMVRESAFSLSRWYGLLKCLSWFPGPFQHTLSVYVAEVSPGVQGMIQVSPFNRSGSTWRIDRLVTQSVMTSNDRKNLTALVAATDIGSLLLRHCFEHILQARTWLLELDVTDENALSLYRHNGFQPVAQVTYWSIAAEQLRELASREPDLPNLMPVSNADAHLLYQLDNMAMPPLVRQVFDRHPQDFKTSLVGSLVRLVKQWMTQTETVSGYVYESQRKVAIAYFQLQLSRDGARPHIAQLTVHPAYTWLYPEVMTQMARIIQEVPAQALEVISADYHAEREAYLERIGAERSAHTLLMSRSVWHKLRETKVATTLDGLQLSDVIPGLQPSRKPVPGRICLDAKDIKRDRYGKIRPSLSQRETLRSLRDTANRPERIPPTNEPHHGDPSLG
jgi:hypothetical protein